ncbi:Hypothetical protein SCLAV_3288 [Streptomyces clavuligerus]|uniref:Uncharacterized protein n=1 Tax=Streptomyces clavuligerus TaxID=1901 RepID=E2PZ28_STRCL|nr:Hypothetical protein SCLAV_3288 [Streptomyces clavuligerus]
MGVSQPPPRNAIYTDLNVLRYPPCECPNPDCTLKSANPRPPESPVLASLRARMQEDIQRRHQFGNYGR